MPLQVSALSEVSIISVHDEEEPIHFFIPSVTPSRYDIPGINAPKEQFESCKFSLPNTERPITYAVRRTKDNRPYVKITIIEPHTFIYGTEQQKMDEYGQKLSPDVMRVPVPVRVELVANEIERQCGRMGLMAVNGEITTEILDTLEKRSIEFMRATVADTNRLAKKSPMNVTAQARRRAARLYKMGLLNPMPEWAEINPEARDGIGMEMMNCVNCGKLLKKSVVKCETCNAIYDWKRAVELGMVKPSDVPPSKLKEAGLAGEEELPRTNPSSQSAKPAGKPGDSKHRVVSTQAPPPAPQLDGKQQEDEDGENPVSSLL